MLHVVSLSVRYETDALAIAWLNQNTVKAFFCLTRLGRIALCFGMWIKESRLLCMSRILIIRNLGSLILKPHLNKNVGGHGLENVVSNPSVPNENQG